MAAERSQSALSALNTACAEDIGGGRTQQDAVKAFSFPGGVTVMAVLDGHGSPNDIGGVSSRAALAELERFLANGGVKQFLDLPLYTIAFIYKMLQDLIKEAQRKLYEGIGYTVIDKDGYLVCSNGRVETIIHGGTTVTIVFIVENPGGESTVYSSHVGDSDVRVPTLETAHITTYDFAVSELTQMMNEHVRDPDPDMRAQIIELISSLPVKHQQGTTLMGNHSPTNEAEYCRASGREPNVQFRYDILHGIRQPLFTRAADGTVIRYKPPPGHYVKSVSEDVAALINFGEASLAMTRALGDLYLSSHGLSNMPTVSITNVPPGTPIIVGSDGIWDNWTAPAFSAYISALIDEYNAMESPSVPLPKYIVDKLLEYTKSEGRKNFGSSMDNMSLACYCGTTTSKRAKCS